MEGKPFDWKKKRLLMVIGAGIAAYKMLDFIRTVVKMGGEVRVILTPDGSRFLTPLLISSLCHHPVYQDLFDLTLEAEMGHIALARWADVVVVAPATAHLMAKMAQGMADDLATTTLLATDKPIVVVPAMNVKMWHHGATQNNIKILKERGVFICGPDLGSMACGEYGLGRLRETKEILSFLEERVFTVSQMVDLKGMRLLITAGPTVEPIDPVRFLSNRSSGRQGYALAEAAAKRGGEVVLVSGPVSLKPPPGVQCILVETAQEMYNAVMGHLPCDMGIFAAAVSDWTLKETSPSKIKKQQGEQPPVFSLQQTEDILKEVSSLKNNRPDLVVGFAAETENTLENGRKKRLQKGCDIMVANEVGGGEGGVFGQEKNKVWVLEEHSEEEWPELFKEDVAEKLLSVFYKAIKKK